VKVEGEKLARARCELLL